MTVAIFLFLFYLCHVIDGGWGGFAGKERDRIKKKKLPGLMTGKGGKTKERRAPTSKAGCNGCARLGACARRARPPPQQAGPRASSHVAGLVAPSEASFGPSRALVGMHGAHPRRSGLGTLAPPGPFACPLAHPPGSRSGKKKPHRCDQVSRRPYVVPKFAKSFFGSYAGGDNSLAALDWI